MDCSEGYILQCQKAEEIQALVTDKFDPHNYIIEGGFIEMELQGKTYPAITFTWLPRIDQLQEMIEDSNFSKVARIYYFAKRFQFNGNTPWTETINSMESLWLAFVMKERFNKVWDSEKKEWIKRKS